MEKQKIFFSYSRADGSAFALRLAVDLKKKGFDVWIDQEDIRAGLDWDIEIEKALKSCDCVLFLETEKSVVSKNVLDEVYYALEQNKKVIPLIYVDSKTPFRLNRLQHIDFSKNYDTGLNLLEKELEGSTSTVSYSVDEKITSAQLNKPFYTKNYRPLLIITSLAVLATAVILLTKHKSPASFEARDAIVPTDTITNKKGNLDDGSNNSVNNNKEGEDRKSDEKIIPIKNNRTDQGKKASPGSVNVNHGSAEYPGSKTESVLKNLNKNVVGDWRLMEVEPKAQSHQGYLKIEALSENRATIKSYIQFYYPESKASSFLTIFNAFAGCNSCVVTKEMKLKVDDIAVSSRTIKRLATDQADGRKAGDVVLDAHSNKSIRGTVTLQFVNNNNAIIRVTQPVPILLANDLMLESFIYTFRFKKND